MTFDELISIRPNVRVADIIQLFLLGYDDKIYIDICDVDGTEITECRIIDEKLKPYYERIINHLEEPSYEHIRSIFEIHLQKENPNESTPED